MGKPRHRTKLTAAKIRQHQGRLGRGKKLSAKQQRILAEEEAWFDAREKEQALQRSSTTAVVPVKPCDTTPAPQRSVKIPPKDTGHIADTLLEEAKSLPYRKLTAAQKSARKSKAGKTKANKKREVVGRFKKKREVVGRFTKA